MDNPDELKKLLQEFIALSDEDAILSFVQTHQSQLLGEEAIQQLDTLAEAAGDEAQRQHIMGRQQLLQALQQMRILAELPPTEQLFMAFMAASNSGELGELALRVDGQALDELEQLAATRRAAAAEDEAQAIQQRLEGLRQVRQQLQASYGDRLPLVRRLHGWIQTNTWEESEAYLQKHAGELLTDKAEAALQQLLDNAPGNPMLRQHQSLLQESRALGIEQTYANRANRDPDESLDPEQAQALADKLAAWIQQETLDEAEAYLLEREAELVTAEGLAVMQMLVWANPNNSSVREHFQRLARAKEAGIATMYAETRRRRLQDQIQEVLRQQGPVGMAVYQFIQVADDDTAVAILQSQSDVLLTWDAGNLLRQLAKVAPDDDRLQRRYQQWLDARTSGDRTATQDTAARQAQTLLLEGQSGPRYLIEAAMFTAVGDNAATLNILNFGQVTLRWQGPQMMRHDLTEKAVGRRDELDELQRLLQGTGDGETQDVAIMGKGRRKAGRGAVQGMPGVGKSTLAALYAQEVNCQADEARLVRTPLPQLLSLLIAHFNLDELKTLCFFLGVDADELAYEGRTGLARELLLYLDRRGRIPELRRVAREQRAQVEWPDAPPTALPEALYPGGVLWLQLGPDYTTPESLLPALSRLAALAYSDSKKQMQLDLPVTLPPQTLEQIQNSLQGAIFRFFGNPGDRPIYGDEVE